MSALIKAGIVMAVGATAVTTTYFGVFHNTEPDYRPLSADTSFSTEYTSGYGKNYGGFLVGVKTGKVEDIDNRDWWDWSFKRRYSSAGEHKRDGFANNIDSGDALRQACEKAYKGTISEETGSPKKITESGSSSGTSYQEQDVWYLCSPNKKGTPPKTLSEFTDGQDYENLQSDKPWKGKSADNGNKTKLLAVFSKDNDWVWKIRQREFEGDKNKSGFFASEGHGSTIRERCTKAYGLETHTSGDDKPTQNDLVKWCGLETSIT